MKPPRHYIRVYFCDRPGNISAIKANNGPERPKIAILGKIGYLLAKNRNYDSLSEKFYYFIIEKPTKVSLSWSGMVPNGPEIPISGQK